MATTFVDYKTDAGLAFITLSDPPQNSFTHEMMKELDDVLLDARFDNDVHVIVITGHGDQFFCAGANVQMLCEVDASFKYYFLLHAHETLNRLENTPKLAIAALNGHALGGGFEIALACDLRIAWQGSGRVGLPDVSLGLMPAAGGSQRLPRLIGRSHAIQLMAEGTSMDYERALEIGLVNYVWPAGSRDEFQAKVVEYARQFLPPAKAARAVGCIKRSVLSGMEMSLDQGLALERELALQLWQSEDAAEGFRSHLEKRKAKFSGR
jgi:enoyl-CoA hydratase